MRHGKKDGGDLRRAKSALVKGTFVLFESLSVQVERFVIVWVRVMFKMALFHRGLATDDVVQVLIIKANGSGVLGLSGINDAGDFRPMDGSETHGTGKAVGVEDAVVEGKTTEICASVADGNDFSVGSGIIGLQDSIMAAGYYEIVTGDDGAERSAFTQAYTFSFFFCFFVVCVCWCGEYWGLVCG